MPDTVIKIEELWKEYRLGVVNHGTLARDLQSWWAKVRRKEDPNVAVDHSGSLSADRFWALQDVSFEVKQGDILGIIGQNGAGKSTLLKVLSQITSPTRGQVQFKGRIASLLEVGTGFHPELTGRENVFLNGAILGMRRAELQRKFAEIVAFADVERFIDTPVKRYSSGMYVRLAFAVAAHLESEILLVDEVLAVGDAQFQRKCLGKMKEVSKQGRTVLFVSHNMVAVEGLCNKGLLLDHGRVAALGPVAGIIGTYLNSACAASIERCWHDKESAPGNEIVRLHKCAIRPENGRTGDVVTVHTPLLMEFEYWNLVPGARLSLSLYLINDSGVRVLNTIPTTEGNLLGEPLPAALLRSTCLIPGDLLNDGRYSIHFHVIRDRRQVIFDYENLLTFEVADSALLRGGWSGKWTGVVRPHFRWTTELVDPVQQS